MIDGFVFSGVALKLVQKDVFGLRRLAEVLLVCVLLFLINSFLLGALFQIFLAILNIC